MATVIGIILATRFLYLDNQYKEIIKQGELDAQTIQEQIEDQTNQDPSSDSNSFTDLSLARDSIQQQIGEYRASRTNIREYGIFIDIFCLFTIIALGIVSTFGVFATGPNFISLVFVLSFLFVIPTSHFLLHVRKISKIQSF